MDVGQSCVIFRRGLNKFAIVDVTDRKASSRQKRRMDTRSTWLSDVDQISGTIEWYKLLNLRLRSRKSPKFVFRTRIPYVRPMPRRRSCLPRAVVRVAKAAKASQYRIAEDAGMFEIWEIVISS